MHPVTSSTNIAALSIHLASKSPVKMDAARLAFQAIFPSQQIEIIGHDSQSGVNSQPFGEAETQRGAANRINSMLGMAANFDSNMLVSMENGLRYSEEENAYYDFVQVIIKKGDATFSYTQDCCKVPADIVNAILKDKDGVFQETWGDVAKRMGLVEQANDPHQAALFGGISRTKLLVKALCAAQVKFKDDIMKPDKPAVANEHFSISRLVNVNSHKSINKYAKLGVLFAKPAAVVYSKPIDLYNQGCPLSAWHVDAKAVKRNEFKVFLTGDPFSILSPDVEVNGANINIHVGVDHASYSPLVLLQEALQLCRCVYEHGAREVTVSLPEQFHPVLHSNDFNSLLMSLFEASGVNKMYFYDKDYKGVLDDTNIKAVMPLTVSQHADAGCYQVSKNALLEYLHLPTDSDAHKVELSRDDQVMHFTRKNYLSRAWSRSDLNHTNLIEKLSSSGAPTEISIPEMTVQPHVLLCCSANKPLAEKIAASLREKGEMVQVHQVEGRGEHATIPQNVEICGAVVTIVQSTRPNPDNMEESQEYQVNGASAYFFEAALIARQAHLRGADKINLINPYQYNARSDKAENNPKGKTGAYVQQMGMLLEAAGVNHVVTAECHDAHTMSGSYTGKNIKGSAVSALSIMATKIARDWKAGSSHAIKGQLRLVTPDAGATKRTKELTLQLEAILGEKLCESRILGEKQRDSHQDDSAMINSLNSGAVGVNARDKYLITDDETATGNTLCQAVIGLKESGASDIAVIVVHNNMPLDWLLRQMCLARFLYIGVNDLHFSDTQEMGTLARSYDDMINTYAERSMKPAHVVEAQVFEWFKKNISKDFSDKSTEHFTSEFSKFKNTFSEFVERINVHSLAGEFAKQVSAACCVQKPLELGVYASNVGGMLLFSPSFAGSQGASGLDAKIGLEVAAARCAG